MYTEQGPAAAPTVPPRLVAQWEAAYRRYGEASEFATRSAAGDRQAATAVASASWDVSVAWVELTKLAGMPWWCLAALHAAADAFTRQAHDWHARAALGTSQPPASSGATVSRRRRVATGADGSPPARQRPYVAEGR